MSERVLSALVHYLRRATARSASGDSDEQLLQRFIRDRDATAFAALLHRYGPLVMAVCRRTVGDGHEAEDAFQATFLVFVRKARSIARQHSLGSWLYGVAYRVARKARARLLRRRGLEKPLQDVPGGDTLSGSVWRDLAPILDEEVNRLPARFRVPFVLCYMEGKSTAEVGQLLGCPRGTVFSRLAAARKRLRERLAGRGLDASPAVLLPLASKHGVATVPLALAEATTQAAATFTNGLAVGNGSSAVALAQGVLRAMFADKLKVIAAGMLTVAMLGAGAGLVARRALAEKVEPAPKGAHAAPAAPGKAAPAKAGKVRAAAKPKYETYPITVTGTASDEAGKPVKGATIYLVSTNGIDADLGRTTTDDNGHYRFQDARLPIQHPDVPGSQEQGAFQVYGAALGHAFAWHGMRSFLPRRPSGLVAINNETTAFANGPLEMNLTFLPARKLRGRILDEAGKPIAGVQVRLRSCDYLDPSGKEKNLNFREFWCLYQAPTSLTTAQADNDGRFSLTVPKDLICWVHFEHLAYAGLSLYAATAEKDLPQEPIPLISHFKDEAPPKVATGFLNITLVAPRQIVLRAVAADNNKPIKGIKLLASSGMSSGNSAYGTTDARGSLEMKLPPGNYQLRADPALGMDFVRTLDRLVVAPDPPKQQREFRINRGCTLILEAIDTETGKGVRDVTFFHENHGSLQASTAYATYPRTDAQGKLRAVLNPGTGRFIFNEQSAPGYLAENRDSGEIELPPGKTVTVTFKLRKK